MWFFVIGFDRANSLDFRILDGREIPGIFALGVSSQPFEPLRGTSGTKGGVAIRSAVLDS